MKNTLRKYLLSSLLITILACQKNEVVLVDKTPTIEKAPTYTPDSPMWKKLSAPVNYSFNEGVVKTETESLYSCVMSRADTTNDFRKVDNFSHINMMGNIDATTTITGTYIPENNYWVLKRTEGIPRYAPILLGPFAVFGRTSIEYFSLFGAGYSINEDYPNGIDYFKDFWLMSDYNQTGEIVDNAPLTGFMANNAGYFLENDNGKQMWHISNIRVYDKRKPFPNALLGKFATASAKIKGKDYGFMISESQDEKVKTKEFYQYFTDTDTWVRKADFPGEDRYEGVIFGINDKIYYGLGQAKVEPKGFRDIWQYDPQTDKWVSFATYPGSGNIKVSTALVSGKVYIGFGYYVGTTPIKTEKYIGVTDFWEFNPSLK